MQVTLGEWLVRRSVFFHKLRELKHTAMEIFRGRQPIYLDFPVLSIPRYGFGKPAHPEILALFDRSQKEFQETLNGFLKYQGALKTVARTGINPTEPQWDNLLFTGLDPVSLYGMISTYRPKQYLEVGSGHSTRFAKKAIVQNELPTKITCIDPSPQSPVRELADVWIEEVLERTDLSPFFALGENDILMIDNSHHSFMNSDVTVFFLEILPKLKKGVIVCIHDIFLPEDYPLEWRDFYYSEQYLLATYLLAAPEKLKILLPVRYAVTRLNMAEWKRFFDAHHISKIRRHENAFWFQVR